MKAITVLLDINRVTLKKDDSVSFSAETPTLTDEELGAFRKLGKVTVRALLEPLEGSDEVMEVKTERDEKTPSQRLRGVLYRLLELDLGRKPTPTEARMDYENKMERIIDRLKQDLD